MQRFLILAVAVIVFGCKKDQAPEDPGPAAASTTSAPAEESTEASTGPATARTTPVQTPETPKTAGPPRAEVVSGNQAGPGAPANGPEGPPARATAEAHRTPATAGEPEPAPTPRPNQAQPRAALPDVRLLLTVADLSEMTGGKVEFQRSVLAGLEPGPNRQALQFEPVKGPGFGFAVQVFRENDQNAARQRYEQMFATYPNSVEVAPLAGPSFFAYWGDVLHVAFLRPREDLVVVVSCGQRFCDSDGLYALAKKVNARIK